MQSHIENLYPVAKTSTCELEKLGSLNKNKKNKKQNLNNQSSYKVKLAYIIIVKKKNNKISTV
jgi:hypothetical protein